MDSPFLIGKMMNIAHVIALLKITIISQRENIQPSYDLENNTDFVLNILDFSLCSYFAS